MTDYYPGFIQDASGAWVTHPQAYQAIPGTTAGVDTGTILQGGVSYTPPVASGQAAAGATAYNAGYTSLTPQYGTSGTTLQGGVTTTAPQYTTQQPTSDWNPTPFVNNTPYPTTNPYTGQVVPGTQTQPTGSAGGFNSALAAQPPSGGVYGTTTIAAPGNNINGGTGISTPGYYLQPNGNVPGSIGAFNPSLYPNGISTLPTNPNDPGSLQYLQAQAAATQAANPAPDARYLPGGIFYGQNPYTTGQPVTTSVLTAVAQNPSAYPQTVVNTVNQQLYGQPLQGSVSTTQTPTQSQQQQIAVQLEMPQQNSFAGVLTGLMAALAQPNRHRIGPVDGYNASDIYGPMPAIAQAQDVMSDIGPTPAQVWAANQARPQALNAQGNPQVQNNPMAYQQGMPQRDYAQPAQTPMPQFPTMTPEMQEYKRLFNQQSQRNQSAMDMPMPPVPVPIGQGPGIRQRLRGMGAAFSPRGVGTSHASQNQQQMAAWKVAAEAAAKAQQDAATHQTGMINSFGNLANTQAGKQYDAAMDAWKAQQLTPELKRQISKDILSTAPNPGAYRNQLIEQANREFNHNFSGLADVVSELDSADLANKRAELTGKNLSNSFNSQTLNDRVKRERAMADLEEDRAAILEATKGAEMRLANARAQKEETDAQIASLEQEAKKVRNQYAGQMAQADLANKQQELANKKQELINKKDAHEAHEQAALNKLKDNAQRVISNYAKLKDKLTAPADGKEGWMGFGSVKDTHGVDKNQLEAMFGPVGKDGLPADVKQAMRLLQREFPQEAPKASSIVGAAQTAGNPGSVREQFKAMYGGYPEERPAKAPPEAYARYDKAVGAITFGAAQMHNLAPIAAPAVKKSSVGKNGMDQQEHWIEEEDWIGDRPLPPRVVQGDQGSDILLLPNLPKPKARK